MTSRRHLKTLIFAVIVLACAALLVSQDALARVAWKHYRLPALATFLDRNDAMLAFDIGNHYFGGGAYDLSRATLAYRRAQMMDHDFLGPRYQLARISFLERRLSEALALINAEIALHPEFIRSYYVRGLVHGYAGHLPEAKADFRRFLEWSPRSWAGHNDLAWIYFLEGDFARAEGVTRNGLVSNPGNPWLLATLGASLLNQDRIAEAEAVLKAAEEAAARLTPADWGRAYPGNDPSLYALGLEEMRATIERNLGLAKDSRDKGVDNPAPYRPEENDLH